MFRSCSSGIAAGFRQRDGRCPERLQKQLGPVGGRSGFRDEGAGEDLACGFLGRNRKGHGSDQTGVGIDPLEKGREIGGGTIVAEDDIVGSANQRQGGTIFEIQKSFGPIQEMADRPEGDPRATGQPQQRRPSGLEAAQPFV